MIRLRVPFALLAVGIVMSGCVSVSDDALRASLDALAPPAPVEAKASTAPTPPPCDPTASLRPEGPLPAPNDMPAGTFMRTIQDRGRLIAGVDQTTLPFGYRDPRTGEVDGFDVDMLREVARAIFGDPTRIQFRTITVETRLPFVKAGIVDIMADRVTLSCARWQEVAFTSAYYLSRQKLLVRSGSTVRDVKDLAGRRVCGAGDTPQASTQIQTVLKLQPNAVPYMLPTRADCLVALQQHMVDAITTDGDMLAGLKKQDPNTELLPKPLADKPAGIAISHSHPEFVRFVNALLERMRTDGTWTDIYKRWIGAITGEAATPPSPNYRD